MKDLLSFLVKEISGRDDFIIEESEDENKLSLTIKAEPDYTGLIIGKGGSTIKAIKNILRIKSALEKKPVFVEVAEKD